MAPRSKFVLLVDDADRAVLETHCADAISFMLASGVNCARAYSEPECSSSRADYLTGRVVARHGVDRVISLGGNLPDTETTIAQHPRIAGRPTAMFGKWHLNPEADLEAPNRFGFDHFSGHIENLTSREEPHDGHNVWPWILNGVLSDRFEYSTTAIVDDFLAWIAQQGNRSVFAVLSFSALHAPYTRPPGSSLPTSTPGQGVDPAPWWNAMAAHLGTELARLFASMPAGQRDGADWILASDNGAPTNLGGKKGTVKELGIRVPVWIRSPECVRPGRSWNLPVMLTDVYRTMTTSGGDDSVDMMPFVRAAVTLNPRTIALAQNVIPGEDLDPDSTTIAGIEQRYKGVQTDGGAWEVYDVLADPTEVTDLAQEPGGLSPEADAALTRIQAAWSEVTG